MPLKDITGDALLLLTESGAEVTDLLSSREGGVTGNAQVWVLVSLRMGGPARPVHLAKSLGITTGGMTKVLDHLEEAGLVHRTREDVEDGRGRAVVLTDQGLSHVDEVLVLVAPAIEKLMDGFETLSARAAAVENG